MAFIPDSIICNLVLGFITLLLALYLYFTARFNYWKDRGIPFVKPIPFFGNLQGQLLSTKHLITVFQEMYDELRGYRYGGYFEMRNPALIIRDPELVERVLVKDFAHFHTRGFPVDPECDPLSASMFNLEGEHWKYLRNKLTPAFTMGKLKGMFEQMNNCGENLIRNIEIQSIHGTSVNLKSVIGSFALDVIASCAFGLQMSKDDEITKHYRDVVTEAVVPSKIQVFCHVLRFYLPRVAKSLGFKSFPDRTEKIIMKIIKDTMNFRQRVNTKRDDFLQLILNLRQNQNGYSRTGNGLNHKAYDMIDQMKHNSKNEGKQICTGFFTDTVIAAQAFLFLVAGSETMFSPLGFVLYELSKNHKIQEKAHKTIDSVLEKHNQKLSYEAVKEMDYISQLLQETFRLHPPSAVLFRTCSKTYRIPGSNDIIEEGTRVIIPVHGIQTDPENYKSPQVFDPERFANNNFKPNGTFLPYGDGPRICIALRFSVLEMKIALIKILSLYTVKLSSKTREPIKLIATSNIPMPEGGWWFEFENRHSY